MFGTRLNTMALHPSPCTAWTAPTNHRKRLPSMRHLSVLLLLLSLSYPPGLCFQQQLTYDSSNDYNDFDDIPPFESAEDDSDQDKTAYPTIRALENGTVGLPCNISLTTRNDNAIKLILWYKGSALGSPIYSVDARDTSPPRHFVAQEFKSRATFELNYSGRSATLVLSPLSRDDAGQYICRVDYKWTRTTASSVKLDVIAPLNRLSLSYSRLHPGLGGDADMPAEQLASASSVIHSQAFDPCSEKAHFRQIHDIPMMDDTELVSLYEALVSKQPSGFVPYPQSSPEPESARRRSADVARIVAIEGEILALRCTSSGGQPNGVVKWHHSPAQSSPSDWPASRRNSSAEDNGNSANIAGWPVLESSRGTLEWPDWLFTEHNESENTLVLGPVLGSSHDGKLYHCRSSNSNLTRALNVIFRVKVLAPPKYIEIQEQLAWSRSKGPSSDSAGSGRSPSFSALSPNQNLLESDRRRERTFNQTLESLNLLEKYLNTKRTSRRASVRVQVHEPVQFLCRTNGSRPQARLSWWISTSGRRIHDITHLSTSYTDGNETLSLLQLTPTIGDNQARLLCRAINDEIEDSLCEHKNMSSQVNSGTLSAGPRSRGSDTKTMSQIIHDQDEMKSDDTTGGEALAEGPSSDAQSERLISRRRLESYVLLDVQYPPTVQVSILNGADLMRQLKQGANGTGFSSHETTGRQLNSTQNSGCNTRRKEGQAAGDGETSVWRHELAHRSQIFLNCCIASNPAAHEVNWFKDSRPIHNDMSKGLVLSNNNRTLVISEVNRESAGEFVCVATNLLGRSMSQRHRIVLQNWPSCRWNAVRSIPLPDKANDRVELRCEIDPETLSGQASSDTVRKLQFVWQFNGTTIVNDTARKQSQASPIEWESLPTGFRRESDSTLDWNEDVLTVPSDNALLYGRFVCWAFTSTDGRPASLGGHGEACQFHLVPFVSEQQLWENRNAESGRRHHHRLHSEHYSSVLRRHGKNQASPNDGTSLQNCAVIESVNSVLINCHNANQRPDDHKGNNRSHSDDADAVLAADPKWRARTYHVQVYKVLNPEHSQLEADKQIQSASEHLWPESSVAPSDWHSDNKATVGPSVTSEHNASDNLISFGSGSASLPGQVPASQQHRHRSHASPFVPPRPLLSGLIKQFNFTNPLLLITDLLPGTNYVFRIWTTAVSTAPLPPDTGPSEAVLEQANFTIQTKPVSQANRDSDPGSATLPDSNEGNSSSSVFSLEKIYKMFESGHAPQDDSLLDVLSVTFVFCLLFILFTLLYGIVKIKKALELQKARREVNVNECIENYESALCEMRPEKLENDLLRRSSSLAMNPTMNRLSIPTTPRRGDLTDGGTTMQFVSSASALLDTYRPYIAFSTPGSDTLSRQGEPATFAPVAESSLLTYQNYLCPAVQSDQSDCTVATNLTSSLSLALPDSTLWLTATTPKTSTACPLGGGIASVGVASRSTTVTTTVPSTTSSAADVLCIEAQSSASVVPPSHHTFLIATTPTRNEKGDLPQSLYSSEPPEPLQSESYGGDATRSQPDHRFSSVPMSVVSQVYPLPESGYSLSQYSQMQCFEQLHNDTKQT